MRNPDEEGIQRKEPETDLKQKKEEKLMVARQDGGAKRLKKDETMEVDTTSGEERQGDDARIKITEEMSDGVRDTSPSILTRNTVTRRRTLRKIEESPKAEITKDINANEVRKSSSTKRIKSVEKPRITLRLDLFEDDNKNKKRVNDKQARKIKAPPNRQTKRRKDCDHTNNIVQLPTEFLQASIVSGQVAIVRERPTDEIERAREQYREINTGTTSARIASKTDSDTASARIANKTNSDTARARIENEENIKSETKNRVNRENVCSAANKEENAETYADEVTWTRDRNSDT